MSLLIPTKQDYVDARDGLDRIPLYHEKIKQLLKERDPQSHELLYPWSFEVVQDFFVQSDDSTDDLNFNYALSDFGIKKPWKQIIQQLDDLNSNAKENESYKLLFLARHGQGRHNEIINRYGVQEWRRKWHNLTADGDYVYSPDSPLTDIGIAQAQENNVAWKEQLDKGAPLPSKFYVSPLQRSCNTLYLTWKDIIPKEIHPKVVENVREIIGFHLCNKRSTKTTILERFGKYGFVTEAGFEEDDVLYTDVQEEADAHSLRTNKFLQSLYEEDWNTANKEVDNKTHQVISVTSHGGTIKTFLAVIGHRHYTIPTGGMIPVVIKATRSL